jgi:Fuc2NAc and GlcNAc transferase
MQYIPVAVTCLALTLTSYLTCKYLVYFSYKHSILDETTQRSSHSRPTPRIGGISFTLLILLTINIFFYFESIELSKHYYLALVIPTFLVAIVSVVDDLRKGISRTVRLSIHLIASVLALALVGLVPTTAYTLIIFCISFIAIAWFINLFNFMDGIDGIAATEAIFILSTLAGYSFFANDLQWGAFQLMILAPILGFAIINWQPAKIFMGDVGSTFLGVLIPILLLISIQKDLLTIWSAIILTSTFLADASWTLLVRFTTGQKWREPHRSHLYQILSRKHGSHWKVCVWNLSINLIWVLPVSVAATILPGLGQLFTLLALLPILILCIMHRSGQPNSN